MTRGTKIVIAVVLIAVLSAAGGYYFQASIGPGPGIPEVRTVTVTEAPRVKELKIAWIMEGPVDLPWEKWQADGMKRLAKEDPTIKVTYAEKVAPADFERVAGDFAAKGYDLVVATTTDFVEQSARVAARYPNTKFLTFATWKFAANLAAYSIWPHEGGYLAGVVAGMMTKTNKIGIVQGFKYPTEVSLNNAYRFGAKSVNKDILVLENWAATWYEQAKFYEGTKAMTDAGADFILTSTQMFGAYDAAMEKKIYAFGAQTDIAADYPKYKSTVITSILWDGYGPMKTIVKAVRDGTFQGISYNFGLKDGAIRLAPFYELDAKVPAEVKSKLAELTKQIETGTFAVPFLTT